MQSKATTVQQYLAELPSDRRAAIQAVREVILKNLDKKYEEGVQYGMIGYFVPHRVFPSGYHCDPSKPLPFASLASQKNHMSLGIMSNYGGSAEEKRFKAEWAKTGKKLDMGACCVRFKKVEDLALDVIGESIRRMPADRFVEMYQQARQRTAKSSAAPRRVATKKTASKTTTRKKTGTKKITIKKPRRGAK